MRKLLSVVLTAMLAVTMSAPKADAVEARGDKELKIGFVYVSPASEAGWSYSHELGRRGLQEAGNVNTSFVESVADGADSERVILNMARKGFDIIFATSFGYMDPTLKISKQFPDTAFMHASGYKSSENMKNYFGRIYQARYLTGIIAGSMTKSNVIGYVAAFPIPEVIRGINAFTLGVQSVNPEAEVRVVWTKTWYDPATEKEAGKSLLDIGADIITQHQDSPGPQEAAAEGGVYSIGYHTDMTPFAPKSHLTAAVWNWADYYKEVVKAVRDGSWTGGSDWLGLETGAVGLAPYGDMVPQEVRDAVEAAKAEIIAGNNAIFVGPLKDQSGAVRVAEGVTLTDAEMLSMMWFVDGVIGTTE